MPLFRQKNIGFGVMVIVIKPKTTDQHLSFENSVEQYFYDAREYAIKMNFGFASLSLYYRHLTCIRTAKTKIT